MDFICRVRLTTARRVRQEVMQTEQNAEKLKGTNSQMQHSVSKMGKAAEETLK